MKIISILQFALFFCLSTYSLAQKLQKPNILIILTDDQGNHDVSLAKTVITEIVIK